MSPVLPSQDKQTNKHCQNFYTYACCISLLKYLRTILKLFIPSVWHMRTFLTSSFQCTISTVLFAIWYFWNCQQTRWYRFYFCLKKDLRIECMMSSNSMKQPQQGSIKRKNIQVLNTIFCKNWLTDIPSLFVTHSDICKEIYKTTFTFRSLLDSRRLFAIFAIQFNLWLY